MGMSLFSVLLAVSYRSVQKSSWPFYYMHAKKNEIVTLGLLQ